MARDKLIKLDINGRQSVAPSYARHRSDMNDISRRFEDRQLHAHDKVSPTDNGDGITVVTPF